MKRPKPHVLNRFFKWGLFLLTLIPVYSTSQQRQWLLPKSDANNDMPMIDFTTSPPTFYTKTLPNSYSTQAIGNGQYCNACSGSPDLISEFFITGNKNELFAYYPTLMTSVYGLMVSWDQICGTTGIQENFNKDECDPTSDLLSHESVHEVAIGDGENPGTFWVVLQNSTISDSSGFNGLGVFVYSLDMNKNSLCGNQIVDIDGVIDAALSPSSESDYNEGIALGPRFIYRTAPGETNPALIALDNHWCRSIYTCSQSGYMYHVLIDLQNPNLNTAIVYHDRYNLGKSKMMEIDLSFPIYKGTHPNYLAATGWDGVYMLDLDDNGKITGSHTVEGSIAGGYGAEFDTKDNYLYYTLTNGTAPDLKRYDISLLANDASWSPGITLAGAAANYMSLETASDYNIYGISYADELIKISDPSDTGAVSGPTDLNSEYPITVNVSFALPDWVDGETPLSTGGAIIEVCADAFGCPGTGTIPVDVSTSTGVVIQHLNLSPGDCYEVNVCPGVSYKVDFNSGSQVNNVYIASSQDYHQFSYNATSSVPNFTNYAVNTTISADLIWDNKIYIGDHVTLTVDNGATLDITNVDVVFGECARIVVKDAANLRANNSVFRPCSESGIWAGIEFELLPENMPTGIVNNCVFKNATVALGVKSEIPYKPELFGLKVTDNLFNNCHIGYYPAHFTSTEATSGNKFVVADDIPEYAEIACSNYNGHESHYGIYAYNMSFHDLISQNEFIYTGLDQVKFVGFGGAFISGMNVTDNRYTNTINAIQLYGSQLFQLENNTVTVPAGAQLSEHQIRLMASDQFHVTGSEMYNLNPDATASLLTASAIYTEGCQLFNLNGNSTEGFEAAFQIEESHSFNITDNSVKDAWLYGVYLDGPRNYYVTCNAIDLLLKSGQDATGIYVSSTMSTTDKKDIRNNCIFETHQAIHLVGSGAGVGDGMPNIKNNYFYNYWNYGVENINLSGNIGSGSTDQLAGKNNFHSNANVAGALDISTAPSYPIISYANTGIVSVSTFVTLNNSDLFASTASCAHYEGPTNAQIWADELCDRVLPNVTTPAPMSLKSKPFDTKEAQLLKLPYHISTEMVMVNNSFLDIYPNPVMDELNVNFSLGDNTCTECSLVITTVAGELVRRLPFQSDNGFETIDISELSKGVYVIKIDGAEGSNLSQRFIKM